MSSPTKDQDSSPRTSKQEGSLVAARIPVKTSLELKLELLEARFTMPAPFPSSATPAAAADPRSPSEATTTLGPFSSPNESAHSFGFGTPSLSNLSSNIGNMNMNMNLINMNNMNNSSSQPLPAASIRNKRRRLSWTNNLHVVSLAAEKHMRKVAASSSPTPIQQQQQQQLQQQLQLQQANSSSTNTNSRSQLSTLASAESNQTLITGHLRPKNTSTSATDNETTAIAVQKVLVVQESPPFMTPAGGASPSVPMNHDAAATARPSIPSSNSGTKEKKRKSIPTKHELPSVKENWNATTENGDRKLAAAPADGRTRKRTRLPFSDKKTTTTATTTATTTTVAMNSHVGSSSTSDSPPTQQSAETNTNTNTANAATATTANTTATATATQNPPLGTTTTTRPSARKAGHNTSIYDFFNRKGSSTAATAKTAAAVSPKRRSSLLSPSPSPSAKTTTATTTSTALRTPPKQAVSSVSASRIQPQPRPPPLPSPGPDRLRQRIQELERLCQDRDEQLAAVSNNRTIVHTALQQALSKTKQEFADLKQEQQALQSNSRRVLEDLSRSDAAREARELRERLATDGARLGRIVYTRAGMRSVETWEDGHSSKQLQKRKTALQGKRQALEKRQTAAKRAAKQLEESKENYSDASTSLSEHDEGDLIGGIHVRTPLEAMEAFESVRFHLSNVRRQEKELVLEDQALNDEKCAHIRALKRVASEDSSRFRSRPKLHDRYVLRALLGKGGFSEVWKAYDLVELREVAVKIHQLDPRWPDAKKENYTKHVSREYEIHRNVRHPRIVSLFDVFEIDNNSFATVLELCNGTDLDAVLKEKKRLAERDARAVLLQILLGMQYLSHPSSDGSRQGIIHYDLKPGNILFDEFGDAKITDFGLSKIVDAPDPAESMELTSQGAGTYWYLPPECFVVTENVRISNKVDVWSIGVIFYQVLYGKRPFGDGQSQDKILSDHTMLNAHEVTFPDKPSVSDDGKQFIRACLTYDQAFRPTIAQVCQHPYVLSKQF